jgi:peptidoglycan/xylan/chitin deacetylase (PgdA/CDA1 family)
MVRVSLKRVTERALVGGGIAHLSRLLRSPGTVILTYHNIIPDGEPRFGDAALHLPLRVFARQLDLLERSHELVPLQAILEAADAGTARPRAVITFDDAYRGAVTAAVDELARRGLPATIFVAPAFVGAHSFWWDTLGGAGGRTVESIRDHALHELKGDDRAVREWARSSGFSRRAVPEHARPASENELRDAARHAGIALASHTWSHRNLTRLAETEVDAELQTSLSWLRARFDDVVAWLAYPYGAADPAVQERVAAAGYDGAVLGSGGWLLPERLRNRYAIRRMNVSSEFSLDGFTLRTSGLVRR